MFAATHESRFPEWIQSRTAKSKIAKRQGQLEIMSLVIYRTFLYVLTGQTAFTEFIRINDSRVDPILLDCESPRFCISKETHPTKSTLASTSPFTLATSSNRQFCRNSHFYIRLSDKLWGTLSMY